MTALVASAGILFRIVVAIDENTVMIPLIALPCILFGLITAIDSKTIDRLPSWIQWPGAAAWVAGFVLLIALNSR